MKPLILISARTPTLYPLSGLASDADSERTKGRRMDGTETTDEMYPHK
jgi:hypothetical protein